MGKGNSPTFVSSLAKVRGIQTLQQQQQKPTITLLETQTTHDFGFGFVVMDTFYTSALFSVFFICFYVFLQLCYFCRRVRILCAVWSLFSPQVFFISTLSLAFTQVLVTQERLAGLRILYHQCIRIYLVQFRSVYWDTGEGYFSIICSK